MAPDVLRPSVEAVENEFGADVYLYSGQIDDSGFGQVVKEITKAKARNPSRGCGLLILTTNGGHANAAYNIARFFQKTYSEFIVFTPSYCKSAGTLVALGAHHLLMDSFSELGPLDVQLYKQNEIMARKSGLLTRSSFESLQEVSFDLYEHFMLRIMMQSDGLVTFQVASELSADMTANLLAPVYGQIDPDVVGSDYRDVRVAIEYGRRLAQESGNSSIDTVYDLVNSYPSHDFIIDDDEARSLFKNVDMPSEALYQLVGCLGDMAYGEQRPAAIISLSGISWEDSDEPDNSGEASHAEPTENSSTGPMDDGGDVNRPSNSEPSREGREGVSTGDGPDDASPKPDPSAAKRDGGSPAPKGSLKAI